MEDIPDFELRRDHFVGFHEEARTSISSVHFRDKRVVEAEHDCHHLLDALLWSKLKNDIEEDQSSLPPPRKGLRSRRRRRPNLARSPHVTGAAFELKRDRRAGTLVLPVAKAALRLLGHALHEDSARVGFLRLPHDRHLLIFAFHFGNACRTDDG